MIKVSNLVLGEQYVSARATPKLVGHLGARDQIHKAIRDGTHSYLIYIYGPGGIGKTWVIRDILENPPLGKNILCAEKLIDLYHIRNNSVQGLIDSLFSALPKFEVFLKKELKSKYAEKAELEKEGLPLSEIIVQGGLIEFFFKTLNMFKGKKRLVIAIDTAEKLLLAQDPIQERLLLQNYIPWVIRWLANDLIPALDNAVIILAGRPEKNNYLRREFEKIKGKAFLPLELKSLSEEEALNYFEAIIEAAKNGDGKKTANYLSNIREAERRDIISHLDNVSFEKHDKRGVRPIMLSLAIDYLVNRNCTVDQLLSILENKDAVDGFESKLIGSFIEGGREADDLIIAMALAPKGIDDMLLMHLSNNGYVKESNVRRLLSSLQNLSFVKFRPEDGRVFLHDEILEMICKRVWKNRMQYANSVRQAITDYYKNLIDENRKKIMDGHLHNGIRSAVRWQQIQTQVEYLHYLLALEDGNSLDILNTGTNCGFKLELFGSLVRLANDHPTSTYARDFERNSLSSL